MMEETKEVLQVYIEDTGIGIREEDQRNLFKLFSRLREGTRLDKNGIGLGLNICKNIVGQFGGKISVSSEYGRGSTFTFAFCLEDERQEEAKEEEEKEFPLEDQ